jgi:hypothetical protein
VSWYKIFQWYKKNFAHAGNFGIQGPAHLDGEGLAAGVDAHGQDRDDAALAELQLGRPARLHEGAGHPQVLHLGESSRAREGKEGE